MINAVKASSELAKQQAFIADHLEGFKDFVLDSMTDGHHLNVADHDEFIKTCLRMYLDMADAEQVW